MPGKTRRAPTPQPPVARLREIPDEIVVRKSLRRQAPVVVETLLTGKVLLYLGLAVGLEPAAIRIAVLSDGLPSLLLEIARLPLFDALTLFGLVLTLLKRMRLPLIAALMLHRLTLHLLTPRLLTLGLLMLRLLALRLPMLGLLVLGLALRLLVLRLSLHLRAGVAAVGGCRPLCLLPARLRHLHPMAAAMILPRRGSRMAAAAILSRLGRCVTAASAMRGRPAAAMTVSAAMGSGGRGCRNGQRRNAGNEHDLRHENSPSVVPTARRKRRSPDNRTGEPVYRSSLNLIFPCRSAS